MALVGMAAGIGVVSVLACAIAGETPRTALAATNVPAQVAPQSPATVPSVSPTVTSSSPQPTQPGVKPSPVAAPSRLTPPAANTPATDTPSRLTPPEQPERPAGLASQGLRAGEIPPAGSGVGDRLRPPAAPTAAPSSPADQLLSQMLRPKERARMPILPSASGNLKDVTSGTGSTAPEAPQLPLLREGTFIVDRTGRLTRSKEGTGLWEFSFDADGRTLRDPPVLLLPNSRLEVMEQAVASESSDIRFRVTGVVTAYRGRNGMLVEKASIVPVITDLNTP